LELGEGDLAKWEKMGELAASSRFEKDVLVDDVDYRPSADKVFSDVQRWQPGLTVIDTIDEMSAPAHYKKGWEQQDEIAKGLKGVARRTRCPIFAIAQAGREAEHGRRHARQRRRVQEERVGELDAELVGWLWGDGSVFDNTGKDAKTPGFNMMIYQAKPHGLGLLRPLLEQVPHHEYVQETQEGWYTKHTFRIKSKWARAMWSRVGLDRMSPEEFVLSLGPKGIEALLRGLWGAEGWMNGNQRMMAQNSNNEFCDAMILATYLGGFRPCISQNGLTNAGNPNINIHFGGQYVDGHWAKMSFDLLDRRDVWCVQTGLGSWTMRQGDHVCLTGNSISIPRKADVVVGLHATDQMKKVKQVEVRALKIRDDEGQGEKMTMHWDRDRMQLRPWTPADAIATRPA
jgi:replicative DNA helicase